ncbi:MAG: hypothetical protein P8R43_01405 [Planctomycetota bacterium]|nr:hypothetical protein [Planctomycetota bacterium]
MKLSTIAWSVLGLILLVVGGSRILAGLGDRETQVRQQLSALVEALQSDGPESPKRFFTRDYIDEDSGTERRPLWSALRDGAADLVPDFDPATGIEFLPNAEADGDDEARTVRVRCLLNRTAPGQLAEPYWNFEAELDLRLERGSWKIHRSREVNLDERGRA